MTMSKDKKKISPLEALKKAQLSTEFRLGSNFEVLDPDSKVSVSNAKKYIAWEKWRDPYGTNWEEQEWPGAFGEFDDDEDSFPELGRGTRVMQTPLGFIPLVEESTPEKVFNFWTGYTNFSITNKVCSIIESVEGVEILNIFTRYRFRIGIGKLFKDHEVMDGINRRIAAYLELKENNPCQLKLSGEISRKRAS